MLAFDTETTGLDMMHGARPFFVTMTDPDKTWCYEWPVDPYTRKVKHNRHDIDEIATIFKRSGNWSKFDEETKERHVLIAHNAKFDVRALSTIGINNWPWAMTRDTLVAAHLINSGEKHDLTKLAMRYLKVNIKPYELALEKAVKQCRSFVRSKKNQIKHNLGKWRIAKKGLPDMPSAKDKTWQFDMWLPKALATHLELPEEHEWHTVLRTYSNADSMVTHALWVKQKHIIEKKGLWKIYLHSMEMPAILYGMEQRGLTVSAKNLKELSTRYREESDGYAADCVDLADSVGYQLDLPKNGVNNSLRAVVFEGFKLPPIMGKKSKTDNPSLDKNVIETYTLTLPKQSKACQFVTKLGNKRSLDTALSFLRGYRRFWLPLVVDGVKVEDWYKLYPSLNQTGTMTTRFSSKNPNEQNVSKKKSFNLRYVFCPAPGRSMWRLDYENLELRIPAYDSNEQDLIGLFERYDEPPYYGSEHILNFSVVYEDLWHEYLDKYGPEKAAEQIKIDLKSTWYGWCKNGDFALQYNCGEATADAAFHKKGCYRKLKQRFSKKEALNQRMIDMAKRLGYVETMPDKTIDPTRGYPLYAKRTAFDKVLPTTPLSYRVQGTAGWVARKAMIRCEHQLRQWRDEGFEAYMDVQVHDELGFDFPEGKDEHLWRIMRLKELMEMSGSDIGVPLKVSVSYHPSNWSEEVKV